MQATVYTDGSSLGNPGSGGCAAVFVDRAGRRALSEHAVFLGNKVTNNEAEYEAVILAMKVASLHPETLGLSPGWRGTLVVKTDSMLLAKQLSGEWKVKSESLKPLWEEASCLSKRFGKVRFVHVRAHVGHRWNERADDLARGMALQGGV